MGALIVRLGTRLASDRFIHSNVQNRHRKNSRARKFLEGNPCRSHGRVHRSVWPPSGQRSRFHSSAQNHHPKIFEPTKFLEGNPYRGHGHAHPSAWLPLGKRSVFIAAHRVATENFSGPKIFGRQSIPQPWARSSFGLAPFWQAIEVFIATHRVATDKFSVPKIFGRQPMPQSWARSSFGLAPFWQAIEAS